MVANMFLDTCVYYKRYCLFIIIIVHCQGAAEVKMF